MQKDIEVIAIGPEGHGFDCRAGQIDTLPPTARHRCGVSSERVAQALSRVDGSRHSKHASV